MSHLIKLILFLMPFEGFTALIPTIQNDPPVILTQVTIVCSPFQITILTIDSTDSSVSSVQMSINVKLIASSGSTLTTKSCELTDSNGCVLTGFSINSAGDYYLTVTDLAGVLLSQSSTFSVVSDLQELKVTSTTLTPSAHFDFVINVRLQDLCGSLVMTSTSVDLVTSFTIFGSLNKSTSSGTAAFTFYSTTTGSLDITVSAGLLSSTLSLNVLQNILKVTSIVPSPSIENTIFSITVKVYSNSGSAVATSHGPFTIVLALVPSDPSLSGTLTLDTSNGAVTFTEILINTSGTFKFEASSSNMQSGSSSDFTLAPAVLTSLLADKSSFTVSTNEDLTVTITAYDQISRVWWKSCTIVASSDSSLQGPASQSTSSGSTIFTLYFSSSGSKTLTFSSGSASVSIPVTVNQNIIKIKSILPTPMFVFNAFEVQVSVKFSDLSQVESSKGVYSLALITDPEFCIQGTVSKDTAAGFVSFTGIEFNKTGDFYLRVVGNDLVQDSSLRFHIIELVLSTVLIDLPEVVTVGFEILVKVSAKDQFGNFWLKSTEVVVGLSLDATGNNVVTTSNGKAEYLITFVKSGLCQVTVVAGLITKNVFINVNSKILEIKYEGQGIKDYQYPVQDYIWISISILDYSKKIKSPESGQTITLTILSSGKAIASYSQLTSSGSTNFTDLLFETPDTYQILASSSDCINSTLSLPPITYGPVTEISVSSPSDPIKTKYLYEFILNLFNSSNLPVPYQVKYSIINEDSQILFKDFANSGIGSFFIVFNETGTIKLAVLAQDNVFNFSVSVQSGNNSDQLCAVALSDQLCVQCNNEASVVVDGVCSCVYRSSYSKEDKMCVCDEGLAASKGFCVKCGKYIEKSDIYAYYSEDYRKVLVNFHDEIEYHGLDTCNKILSLDSVFTRFGPVCEWILPQQLEISFKLYPDLAYKKISFNNTLIQKVSGACIYSVDILEVDINQLSKLPVLQVSINGPEIFSLKCSSGGLVLKSSIFSIEYSYTWKLLSESSQDLKTFISNTSTSIIQIPLILLSKGDFYISLTVSIPALQVSGYSTKLIKVSELSSPSLEFNIGAFTSISRSQSLFLEVLDKSSCLLEFPELTWTSSNIANFENLIKSSKSSKYLIIPANTLTAGSIYSIQVTSQSQSLSTQIQVLTSDLILTLSKSSGLISLKLPLVLSVTAVDPDDSSSQFTYKWTCSQDNNPCYTRLGQLISFQNREATIKISNSSLMDGNIYKFQVQVTSLSKSSQASVFLTVDSRLSGSVEVSSISSVIKFNQILKIIPKVNLPLSSKFKWKVINGKFDLKNSDLNKPYFCALGSQFEPGSEFSLVLSSNDGQNDFDLVSLQTSTGLGPDCGSFEVEIEEFLYMAGKKCLDLDDQDYPIVYKFGFEGKTGQKRFFGGFEQNEEIFVFFNEEMKKSVLLVCDSSFMCKEFKKDLNGLKQVRRLYDGRGLGKEVNVSYYLEFLKHDKNVLDSILALKGQELTGKEFDEVFSAFLRYFEIKSSGVDNFENLVNYLDIVQGFKNFDKENFDQAFELMKKRFDSIDFVITKDMLYTMHEMLYKNRYYLGKQDFFNVVSVILNRISEDYLPPYTFSYDTKFISFVSKINSDGLLGLIINLKDFDLVFPEDLQINDLEIINIQIISCDFNKTVYFSLSVNTTGTYESFNLEESQSSDTQIKISSPIILEIYNTYSFNSSKCGDLKKVLVDSCKYSSTSDHNLIFHIYKTGSFSLFNQKSSCKPDDISFILNSSIFTISLLYCAVILLHYRSQSRSKSHSHSLPSPFYSLLPISSILLFQPVQTRLTSALLLSSSILVLQTSLKLTSNYLFQTSSSSSSPYSSSSLLSGFLTFLLCQPVTLLQLSLQYSTENTKFSKLPLTTSVLLSSVSICYSIFQYFSLCIKSFNWVLNLIIFSISEIFLFQPIYTWIIIAIASRCKSRNNSLHTARVMTLAEEPVSSRSDNLAVVSMEVPEEEKTDNVSRSNANPQNTISAVELETFFERRPQKTLKTLKSIKGLRES